MNWMKENKIKAVGVIPTLAIECQYRSCSILIEETNLRPTVKTPVSTLTGVCPCNPEALKFVTSSVHRTQMLTRWALTNTDVPCTYVHKPVGQRFSAVSKLPIKRAKIKIEKFCLTFPPSMLKFRGKKQQQNLNFKQTNNEIPRCKRR